MVATLPQRSSETRTKLAVIDGDVHVAPANDKALGKYMSERWRRHHETFGGRGHAGAYYPRANMNAARTDSWPPNGGPPGSDLAFLREQLLDAYEMDYAIMTPLLGSGGQLNLEYGAAHATAVNDWQIAEWCEAEPRMIASACVAYEDGNLAATEIRRVGRDRRFVQVLLSARTSEPLGRRKYWPMYEAAVENDMPIAFHFGGAGGSPYTGAGWPSFYYEDHCGMPPSFEAQVISLIYEGVFERFPTLRFVLIEGGFGWLPSLGWRMDRSYEALKDEVPHLRRRPSEYIRDHIWLTTQPVEEPGRPEHFRWLIEQIGQDRLMFATDYPHWDFDSPDEAVPLWLPEETRASIMAETARDFYKLGTTRS